MKEDHSLFITNDISMIDIEAVHAFLSNEAYWAKNRSIDVVRQSIENSICFALLEKGSLVGFARVVTDKIVVGWILDVFVVESHRQKGLGKMLIQSIFDHSELCHVKKWLLGTKDAHPFYRQFGFKTIDNCDQYMEKYVS